MSTFTVFVRFVTEPGSCYKIEVDPVNDTIAAVRLRVAEELQVDAEDIVLRCEGEEVVDMTCLGEGSEVEAGVSARFEARQDLKGRGMGWVLWLYEAITEGDIVGDELLEVVSLMLQAGADVREKNYIGFTPLHGAAVTGNIEVTKLLLAVGADPNQTGGYLTDPADVALAHGHADMAAYLRNVSKKPV